MCPCTSEMNKILVFVFWETSSRVWWKTYSNPSNKRISGIAWETVSLFIYLKKKKKKESSDRLFCTTIYLYLIISQWKNALIQLIDSFKYLYLLDLLVNARELLLIILVNIRH